MLYKLSGDAERRLRNGDVSSGNAGLMQACCVSSRQSVNDIFRRVAAKGLVEKVSNGNGGRGLATRYRICVEDPRFPSPKAQKPSNVDLQVSRQKPANPDLHVSAEKPANEKPETRKSDDGNPQIRSPKPANLDLHTSLNAFLNDHPLNHQKGGEVRAEHRASSEQTTPRVSEPDSSDQQDQTEVPHWLPLDLLVEYEKMRKRLRKEISRKLLIETLTEYHNRCEDVKELLRGAIVNDRVWFGKKNEQDFRRPLNAVPANPERANRKPRVFKNEF